MRKFLMGILAAMTIIMLGMAAVLHNSTIIDWWKPVYISLFLAIPTGFLLSKITSRITRFSKQMWNILCAAIFSFAIFIGIFYTLNYYNSDTASGYTYSAPVLSKYTKEHYRVQRLSRNRVKRGEKYLRYYITIELPDGKTKNIDIPLKKYQKIKKGRHIPLQIAPGFFGVPVIKNFTLPA